MSDTSRTLTRSQMSELVWYFNHADSDLCMLRAQGYEPHTTGGAISFDDGICSRVDASRRSNVPEGWEKVGIIERTRDRLRADASGHQHWRTLMHAMGPLQRQDPHDEFKSKMVASLVRFTPSAQARGLRAALSAERRRTREAEERDYLTRASQQDVDRASAKAIDVATTKEHRDETFLMQIRSEALKMLGDAAHAWRIAREAVDANERASRATILPAPSAALASWA